MYVYNIIINKTYNLLRESVFDPWRTITDLTNDSLNESIIYNDYDKQIVPYDENKNHSNKNIRAHSTDLSIGKDYLTITSEESNKIVPLVQDNICNSNVMENISLHLVGETLSEATI